MKINTGKLLSIAVITLTVGFFFINKAAFAQDANTVLLLHMDGTDGSATFTDSSDSAHTVTANGNVQIDTAQSKFGGTSAYLDGSDDYLSIPDNADWDVGLTGDYTIDLWVKHTQNGGDKAYVGQTVDVTHYWYFHNSQGNGLQFRIQDGTTVIDTGVFGEITDTDWHHVAMVKSGTTYTVYKDGNSISSVTDGRTASFASNLLIGELQGGQDLDGQIDELRISKGIARWSSSFTPPAAPYDSSGGSGTQETNTKLLLHMDGTNGSTTFTDSSVSTHAVTANGNVQISTAQSKFGGTSAYFDGNGDYLTIPDSVDWDFGSGDFTIDFWVNYNNKETHPYLIEYGDNNGNRFVFSYYDAGPTYSFYVFSGSSAVIGYQYSVSSVTNGQWYHIALVRSGNNFELFENGVSKGSFTDVDAVPEYSSPTFALGTRYTNSSTYLNGYIDEFRISKGIARWTSNYTPPTAPYGDTGGGTGGGSGGGHSLDAADGDPVDAVFVDDEGNVGIGTTNPGIYKLAVNGKIKTKEVVVELTGWSDFVFKDHYALMPLWQLERYIANNKHLPQIPSAEEVAEKGVSVGDMQSRLLQKIEELTLYVIKLEQKTDEFKSENEILRGESEMLQRENVLVKKRLTALEIGYSTETVHND
jgi:hypothetical protein